jgi:hypothetical protein
MLTWLIRAIHLVVVLFFVFAPFSSSESVLTLHLVMTPFLLLHWITNQSVCALTELEKCLTGKTEDHHTFMGQIMGPIYTFQSPENETIFVWGTLVVLWLITLYKLQKRGFKELRTTFSRLTETLRR